MNKILTLPYKDIQSLPFVTSAVIHSFPTAASIHSSIGNIVALAIEFAKLMVVVVKHKACSTQSLMLLSKTAKSSLVEF